MKLGVCYYPEHWPEKRWPTDAKLMREAGLSLVRIAEFAWGLMEPREGEFTWSWLDRAVDVLAAEGLEVVLGTPTASPPPWLCRAYPSILPVDVHGRRRRHGSRRHYCPSDKTYRQHTERIVTALASRYGSHPAVVGWQIDNEFGCHYSAHCYCENCAEAFRRWLETKYRSIDVLNDSWGNVFWSQIYDDWSEIDLPNLTVAEPNPSHVLDYYRFSSDTFVSYQQLQLSTLRALVPDHQLVTTNFMSRFSDLDYHDLADPLDLVTMSSYPTGHSESRSSLYMPASDPPLFPHDVGDPYVTSFGHTLMRGFKPNRPFWIMEQQCGNVNWSSYNSGVGPGATRLWTWHALASGAEAVLYFRWRACLYAQEQLHSGLLHHDGESAVGYSDVLSMAAERELMSEIASEPHIAQIAFLLDYDALWALQLQPHNLDFGTMRQFFVYYLALQRLGLPADIIAPDADLSAYKMVIVPSAYVATDQLADSLKSFARDGGTVLLGVRSGFKTTDNLVTDQAQPGPFRELVAINVSDWHSLPPGASFDLDSTVPGLVGPATLWAEMLRLSTPDPEVANPDLQALAHYVSGPFASQAALVEHKIGVGRALYLGWYPNDSQAEALLAHLASQDDIPSLATLPDGVIASRRGQHLILLNFTDEPQSATVQGRPVTVPSRDAVVVKTDES